MVVYIGLKTENKIEYVTNKDGTILGFNNTKVAKKFLLRIGLTPMEIMNYEFISYWKSVSLIKKLKKHLMLNFPSSRNRRQYV